MSCVETAPKITSMAPNRLNMMPMGSRRSKFIMMWCGNWQLVVEAYQKMMFRMMVATRDEYFQLGIALLEAVQGPESLRIAGETLHDQAVFDIGEGIVDVGEFLRRHVAGDQRAVGRIDVADDRLFGRLAHSPDRA